MRDEISAELKTAMREKDQRRISTLRLINAAIQDRDISLRGKGKEAAGDEEILDLLTKMVKQREESSKIYDDAGRDELAVQEREEIEIIKGFLPQQLSKEETEAAVKTAIAETDAQSLRDMGKVMAYLKEHHRGQLDMGVAGPMVKQVLGA